MYEFGTGGAHPTTHSDLKICNFLFRASINLKMFLVNRRYRYLQTRWISLKSNEIQIFADLADATWNSYSLSKKTVKKIENLISMEPKSCNTHSGFKISYFLFRGSRIMKLLQSLVFVLNFQETTISSGEDIKFERSRLTAAKNFQVCNWEYWCQLRG